MPRSKACASTTREDTMTRGLRIATKRSPARPKQTKVRAPRPTWINKNCNEDLPTSPEGRALPFHYRGRDSIPSQETKSPHAERCGKNKKQTQKTCHEDTSTQLSEKLNFNNNNNKQRHACRATGTLIHYQKTGQLLWKTLWQFLNNLNLYSP